MPQFQILEENPSFGSQLGQQLGQGVGGGIQNALGEFHKAQQLAQTENTFMRQGYPQDLAKLAAAATTGGQTEVLKTLLDIRQRSNGFSEENQDKDSGFFEEEIGIGRTPKEKVARVEKQEQRSFDRNKKYLDRISAIADEMPKEKLALSQMKGAIDSKDFNSYKNIVAEMTGLEVLKTASAQTVNSAAKQFLMSSLASIAGRPNQFIEQQISKALISPLYKNEVNDLIFEGLEGLSRLKEKEVELAENLEEKYTSRGKEIPRNFQKIIRENLKKEASDFEKNYEERVAELLSSKKGSFVMIDPAGNKRSVPKKDVQAAKKAGYRLGK